MNNTPPNIFMVFPLPGLLLLPDAPDFTITDINPAFSQATGLGRELKDKTIFDAYKSFTELHHTQLMESLRGSLLTVMATGKPHALPVQRYTIPIAGTNEFAVKYWIPENIPVLDDQHNLCYIIHQVHDITEKQLSLLVNNTEEPFLFLDIHLSIISFNTQFYHLYKTYFGIEVKKGHLVLDYAQPERKEIVKSIYERVLKGGTEKSNIQIPLSDNDVKHFSLKFSPAKDDSNQIIGVVVTARDITEEIVLQNKQQMLFNELKQRNTFIETILQNIPIGIAVNKINEGTATFVNPFFSSVYGWNEKVLTDINSFFEKVYPDPVYRKEISERVISDIQSGDPERMSWNGISITTEAGEKRIINAKNIPLPEQNLMISTATDITQSAMQTEEIIRIKTNQEALINNTDDLIWSLDTDFKLIAANTAFIKDMELITGLGIQPGDDLLLKDFFPEDYLSHWKTLYQHTLAGNVFQEEIYTPPLFKRPETWSEIRFNPIYRGTAVVGIACYSRNITEAKSAEVQLRQSEALLAEAQRLTKMGSWSFDLIRDKLTWSDELYHVFGNDKQNFPETYGSYVDLIDEEDRLFVQQTSKNTQQNGEPFTIQYHITTPKGEKKIIEEHGYGQKDKQGKLIRLFGTAQDITERKKAEEAISSSEEKRRLIMNAALDAIICIDINGNITFWNPQAEFVFGWKEQEVLNRRLSDTIIPPSMRSMHNNGMVTYLKTGHAPVLNVLLELSAINRKGEEFPVELTILPIKQDKEEFFCAFLRDITERKKAEKSVKESEAKYRSLVESSMDGILLAAMDGTIISANTAACEMFRMTEEEICKAGKKGLVDLSDPRLQPLLEASDRSGKAKGELVFMRKDGSRFPGEMASVVFTDTNGLQRTSMIIRDITEIKKATEELKELNESLQSHTKELARSNMELEQFAYVASHDLQEPLRMITNFLAQLEKKYGDTIDEKGKTYIDFAVDGAKRMRRIILDLLEFSRVGKNDEAIELLDLNDLIHEIQILYRKQIEEKQAIITAAHLPVITAHKSPVRQVFQNLIGNALKYSKAGIPSEIHIAVKEEKTNWQFAVSDNGIGIGKEYYDKIFILFQRLHSRSEYSGTGIGLSITKKIIENMGGKIWVISKEGDGSTFYFTFTK